MFICKEVSTNFLPVGELLRKVFMIGPSSIFFFLVLSSAFAQSQLLNDINHHENVEQNEFSSLTDGYNKIYFINHGAELWKTTGNEGGTVRLKSFKSISNLTLMGTTIYFSADDGNGIELWKSTGTSGSTVKVKDFVPGPTGGDPNFLTPVNGVLYFVAYTATHGRELWKTDGTDAGTGMVKDILRVKGSSNPSGLTNVNGTLFFAANDGRNGYEIWKTDGTAEGTQMVFDVKPGAYLSSSPQFLTNVNGTLFFVATDGIRGRELFKTNGLPSGSMRVKDIKEGSGGALIDNMTSVNNTLFFTANDGVHGAELWKSDGSESGTVLVKDMTPGRNGSHGEGNFTHDMGNFKSLSGLLYYTAYQNDTYYIWKSDGTESGTVPLHVAYVGINKPIPRFVQKGNYIYYFNSEAEYPRSYFFLYRMNTDGSNPTTIAEFYKDGYYSYYNPELISFKNTLYMYGRTAEENGAALWRSDGTPGSRVFIKDVARPTLSSEPYSMVKAGDNHVFFIADEIQNEAPTLWSTDGTAAGTIKLHDFPNIYSMVGTSTHVFYSLYSGLEIWKSDGSHAGTTLVKADASLPAASNLVNVNDLVFYKQETGGIGRTDGTEAGTFQIVDEGNPRNMVAVEDLLLFTMDKGNHVVELWRSNGMPGGTWRILTFLGRRDPLHTPTAVAGNRLFFIADNGITGNEVWSTDGTLSGTYQVADLNAHDDNLAFNNNFDYKYEDDIRSLAVWNSDLYIAAFDNTSTWGLYKSEAISGNVSKLITTIKPLSKMVPVNNRLHLFPYLDDNNAYVTNWVTDGTVEGSQSISDTFLPANFQYSIQNDILYSFAADGTLWRSDGTVCGTYGISPGVFGSDPMETIGDVLVFKGQNFEYGTEPFAFNLNKVPRSSCAPSVMATVKRTNMESLHAVQEENIGNFYPNPFQHDLSFRVNGKENAHIEVEIITSTGYRVEQIRDLVSNTDYRLGSSWPSGLYVLHIKAFGKVTTQKVLKK